MAGKKGMSHYSKETKLLAVQLYLEKGQSQREIAQDLGLPRKELVEQWVHRYRYEGEANYDRPIGRLRKAPQS